MKIIIAAISLALGVGFIVWRFVNPQWAATATVVLAVVGIMAGAVVSEVRR